MINRDTVLNLRQKPGVWDGQAFKYAEFKLDGVRMTVIVEEDGAIFCIGRKRYINLWPRLQRQELIADHIRALPPGTVMDGELHTQGGTSSDVTSLLVKGSGLTFTPWNVTWYQGRSMMEMDYHWHRNMVEELGFLPPRMLTFDAFALTVKLGNAGDIGLKAVCEIENIEGFVLKADPIFCWWKLKPILTVDCIVTGWEEGTSRNKGRLGALKIGVLHGPPIHDERMVRSLGNVGTGFSDQQRDEIGPECVGRVVEVAYDCVAAQGKLRFPRFMRFRDDKPYEECDGREL